MSVAAARINPSIEKPTFNPEAERLVQSAVQLNRAVRGRSAEDALRYAIEDAFRGRIALVSSFGAEAAVLLKLVADIDPSTPVLFLETGKHFAQTLSYRRQLSRMLGLTNVRDIFPDAEELAAADPGGDLWRSSPDACCSIRKVHPLKVALAGFDAWITGRKQFHGGARVDIPIFETASPHIKVNPLASWAPAQVQDFMIANDLPAHPLVAQGYPSIGCWPCTHPAGPGEDPRAGRWRGLAKTECGIHEDALRRGSETESVQSAD